jgi:hypothetical protein
MLLPGRYWKYNIKEDSYEIKFLKGEGITNE